MSGFRLLSGSFLDELSVLQSILEREREGGWLSKKIECDTRKDQSEKIKANGGKEAHFMFILCAWRKDCGEKEEKGGRTDGSADRSSIDFL